MCVVHDKLIDFYMDKVASFIAESQSHYSAQQARPGQSLISDEFLGYRGPTNRQLRHVTGEENMSKVFPVPTSRGSANV